MAILDDILAILKGANPSGDDAALKAQAAQLASHPDAPAVMSALSPSDFDVSTSDTTVAQNGNMPSLPSGTLPTAPQSGESVLPTPPPASIAASVPPPATSPVAPPQKAAVAPPSPSSPPTNTPMPDLSAASNDQVVRQAKLDTANRQAKMAVIPAAIAGIGGAIGNAASVFGAKVPEGAEENILNRAQQNLATNKTAIESGISNDPNSDASKTARSLVLQIAPQLANQPGFSTMTDQELRDKLPLVDTMMKAKASEDAKKVGLAQAQSNRELSMGLRQDQQQDKLEQNAKQMVANLRGDKSLARTEEQRDAAIVAYNRLDELQKAGKGVNPVDYTDILGQIYKARTGAAPSEQVLQNIRQSTAQGQLDKAYTYITGNQAPATSNDIITSLKNMASSMGQQADKFHKGYMNSHLIKPSGLEDSRWQPIADTGRGVSFADATKTSTPAASTSAGPARQTSSGNSYTVQP